jgi:MFS family permease
MVSNDRSDMRSALSREASESRTTKPRSNLALLLDRNFGPWFFGNLVSTSGDWAFTVSASVVVYELSGSALLIGLVAVSQFLPVILFAPFAGGLTDRRDPRRLLIAGQTFAAVCSAALAVPALLIGVEGFPGPWPVIAAAFGIGLGKALSGPAVNSLVPSLVDDRDLEGAIALSSMTHSIGRALGPAAAGVLLVTLGAGVAFALNAVSFFLMILALLVVRVRPRQQSPDVDRSIRAGFRYVRREDRGILLILAGVAAVGFSADPVITLGPPLAESLGAGDDLVAATVSGFGVAAALAALVSGRLQRRLGAPAVAGGGLGVVGAGSVVVALSGSPVLTLLGFAATGAGFSWALTSFTTALQRRLPDVLRGRIMALWSVAFLGVRPVAAVLNGAAADLAGPRVAMCMTVVVVAAGILVAVRLVSADRAEPPGPR